VLEPDVRVERREPSAFRQVDPGDLGSNQPMMADWDGWMIFELGVAAAARQTAP
jgi:hypothetical protein